MRLELVKRGRAQINIFPRLSDVEIQRALAVGPEIEWYRAVLQIINDHREDAIDAAASHVAQNNQMAAVGAVGAEEVLRTLMESLNAARTAAVSDKV